MNPRKFLKELHSQFLSRLPEDIVFVSPEAPSEEPLIRCWDLALGRERYPLTGELVREVADAFVKKLKDRVDQNGEKTFVSRSPLGDFTHTEKNVSFSYSLIKYENSLEIPNYWHHFRIKLDSQKKGV